MMALAKELQNRGHKITFYQFADAEADRTTRPVIPTPPQHDYYLAETQGGQRFWLCCEGPERPPQQQNWFMRGLFA